MFKKIIKGLVIGGAALTIASSASARLIEVNIYGASAQYSFWTSAAPKYLADTAANGGYNCGAANVYHVTNKGQRDKNDALYDAAHDRDMGIAVCKGKTAIPGSTFFDGTGTKDDTLIIRYTTNASYDGIYSIMDDNTYSPDTACTTGGQRKQGVVDNDASFTLGSTTAGKNLPHMACMDVHVGASDVAAATFGQASEGWASGPAGGSVQTNSYYNIDDPEDAGYKSERPVVVPFGFYANDWNQFTNMTRPMAVNIFSGGIANWNQFGIYEDGFTAIPDKQVTVCLRHAGSGTHATLDAAIMRGDASLPAVQQDNNPASSYFQIEVFGGALPIIYFNKGTTEELNCVASTDGAVGYADSDKVASGTHLMKYNGVEAKATYVKNGQYDFWSAQWLYYNANDTFNNAQIASLINYASVGANMPSSKAAFWAAQNDLKFVKGTDFSLPFRKQ